MNPDINNSSRLPVNLVQNFSIKMISVQYNYMSYN